MLIRLFLLFSLLPLLELTILILLGTQVSAPGTLLLVLGTGVIGAWLARREGFAVMRQLRDDLQNGIPPASRLAEGALVLAGGLLLLTPGLITDVTGLLLILPWTRAWIAPRALRWLLRRFNIDVDVAGQRVHSQERVTRPPPGTRPPPFDHPVH